MRDQQTHPQTKDILLTKWSDCSTPPSHRPPETFRLAQPTNKRNHQHCYKSQLTIGHEAAPFRKGEITVNRMYIVAATGHRDASRGVVNQRLDSHGIAAQRQDRVSTTIIIYPRHHHDSRGQRSAVLYIEVYVYQAFPNILPYCIPSHCSIVTLCLPLTLAPVVVDTLRPPTAGTGLYSLIYGTE